MLDRGLDLTDKATWHPDNAEAIAGVYGYEPDGLFGQAFTTFVDTIVQRATVTDHLASVATRHFGNFQPPLNRRV